MIAADWIGKNLYWTDLTTGKIEMCRYNLSRHRTVIKQGLVKPFGLTLDPING